MIKVLRMYLMMITMIMITGSFYIDDDNSWVLVALVFGPILLYLLFT